MTLAASIVLVTTVVVELGMQQNFVSSPVEKSAAPAIASATKATASPSLSSSSSTTEADKLTDAAATTWAVIAKEVAPATPAPLTLKKSLPQAAAGSQRDETVNARVPSLSESVAAPAAIAASQPVPSPPTIAAPLTDTAIDGANGRNDAAAIQAFVASGANTSTAADKQTENAKPEQTSLQAMPQAWLDHIRTLRKQGKSQQADEEWQRFKQAWPQYPVTDDDAALSK